MADFGFDPAQMPYLAQMFNVALMCLWALLVARHVAHYGATGMRRQFMVEVGMLFVAASAMVMFGGFAAIALAAGAHPIMPAATMIPIFRNLFAASAAFGMLGWGVLLGSMVRGRHGKD